MSDTPRTYAAEFKRDLEGDYWVKSDFARELERELAQRTAERDEARREVCRARSNPWIPNDHITVAAQRGWDCFDAPHTNANDVPVQDGGAA